MIDYALLFEAAAGAARTALATVDSPTTQVSLAMVEMAAIREACTKLPADAKDVSAFRRPNWTGAGETERAHHEQAVGRYTRQHAIPHPMPRRTPVEGSLEDMRRQARSNLRAAAQRERQLVDAES